MIQPHIIRRTLVALAALSVTGAFAQAAAPAAASPVTWSVFGTFDLGTRNYSRDVTSAGATGHQDFSQLGGVNSSDYTNALGVRGNVDIGGGNNVGFNLTWAMNPAAVSSNGTPSATSNNSPFNQVREGYVSFNGGWGRLLIGSSNNLYQAYASSGSTMQDVNVGGSFLSQVNGDANGRGAIAMLNTAANHNGSIQVAGPYLSVLDGYTGIQARYENTLTYWTPVMSGFTAGVTGINTTTAPSGTTLGTTVAKLSGSLLQATYDNGPLSSHAAYMNLTQESTTAKRAVTTTWVQGSYDFGVGTGWASYSNSQNNDQIGTSSITAKGLEVGVRFPVGQWTPYVFVGKGDLSNSASYTSTGGAFASGTTTSTIGAGAVNISAYQIGAKYSLSKNVTLFGGLGETKFENANNSDADKVSGYQVGVTLTF